MVNKSFSIYNEGEEIKAGPNQQVVVEIGKTHLASIIYDADNKSLTAFELFEFKENDTDNFNLFFSTIVEKSKTLSDAFRPARIFINHEFCLPVPTYKFNKDIAADYLNIVFGNTASAKIKYDHVAVNPDIINVFKVSEDCITILNDYFSKITFQHTYSSVIRNLMNKTIDNQNKFIGVDFYNSYMIVAVMLDGKLQLIQSIEYHTSEDVIYYLLNIAERYLLTADQLSILISGMIDLEFNLYRQLIKYFKNVQVMNESPVKTGFTLTNHPSHYFMPFFKLAI